MWLLTSESWKSGFLQQMIFSIPEFKAHWLVKMPKSLALNPSLLAMGLGVNYLTSLGFFLILEMWIIDYHLHQHQKRTLPSKERKTQSAYKVRSEERKGSGDLIPQKAQRGLTASRTTPIFPAPLQSAFTTAS